jgi:predicted alpha/beta superfamily hydrolase
MFRSVLVVGCCSLALMSSWTEGHPALLPPDAAWTSVPVPGARQVDVQASRTGHRYRIFVAVPVGPVPVDGYPVLYVLDGNAAFGVAAFLARNAASRREVTGHDAPLVVGIGYPGDADFDVPARRRDYTLGPVDASATEGGAPLFLDFIEQDVKPMIAARHRVDARRQALFGHSFGGLFVLYALFNRPAAFSTYLASSPSIWWTANVLAALPDLEGARLPAPPRVQITVGALEDDPPTGKRSPEMLATIAGRRMIEPARGAAARLRDLPGWSERVAFLEIAGENHGTVWLTSLARGMQLFLEQPVPAAR